jgi:hypothetical protein
MVESFDERYAKALVLKKVKQGAKWLAATPLVPEYVWMVDTNPYANDYAANKTFQLKMAAWPNPDYDKNPN